MEEEKDKKDYKYFAFISYTEADYDMVKWLHRKLEFYHISLKMRKKHPQVPKKWTIYEYKSEMKGGYLEKEIHKALDNSKYLIVVCSPNAKVSEYVKKEINYYKKIGREAYIIPFIIEGEAYSKDPKKECFPAPLLKTGLRGISINELGRDAAAVKIIAQMFGIEFDELWQRYEKEMKRKRNIMFLGVIALAIVSLIVALWMWHLKNQVTITNEKLIKENIRISSREVLNLLEKGQFVDAEQQVEAIVDFWKKECNQEVPEMEQALRAFYRYEWKDGIVKLNSLPLSDEQQFLSADSNYLYILDKKGGSEKIIGYSIYSRDSVKQVFPKKDQKINNQIRDFNYGLVLCKNQEVYSQWKDGTIRSNLDTIRLYEKESGKMIMEKIGRYAKETILGKDKILFVHYDTLSRKTNLELVRATNGQIITQWPSPFKYAFDAAFLNNDSLTVVGSGKVVVYNVKEGKKLYEIDYRNERIEMGYELRGNQNFNKISRHLVTSSEYGLRLFSTEKHNCSVLNKSSGYSSVAYNPSGIWLAAVKNGRKWEREKDSIIVFSTEFECPIFSTEGDDFGDIIFANDNIIVEGSYYQHRINVYSCEASFFVSNLISTTGNYHARFNKVFNKDEGISVIPVIYNDSTDEVICKIHNSEERILDVYDFSPQDTYLMYGTDVNPMVLHHIKKNKDIVIPLLCENLQYCSFDYCMSDNESKLFYRTREYAFLYNLTNDTVKIIPNSDYTLEFKYALSANGSRMAVSEDRAKIYVFALDSLPNMPNNIEIEEIGNCSVRNLCFSKGDSRFLAASYSDGTIRFWNTFTGKQMYNTIHSETKGDLYLDISSDAKYLVGTNRLNEDDDKWEYLIWHIPSGILVDKETNAWSWWSNSILQDNMQKVYRARFASNSNMVIVNGYYKRGNHKNYLSANPKYYALSRTFSFPSFNELIELYSKKSEE